MFQNGRAKGNDVFLFLMQERNIYIILGETWLWLQIEQDKNSNNKYIKVELNNLPCSIMIYEL